MCADCGMQRPQHRHELRRVHVLHGDDLRDELVGAATARAIRKIDVRHLPRVRVRHDLDDAARLDGDELVHLQQREERFVERIGRHRRLRQHRDLRAHARVGNDGLAGGRRDRFDDLADLGVLEVRRDALAVEWPVFWALTRPVAVNANSASNKAHTEGSFWSLR